MDVKVVAAYEEYHRILAKLSSDLKDYANAMHGACNGVSGASHSLANDWQGDAYEEFRNDTNKALANINASLERVHNLTAVIDNKVPQIAKAIELLKGNG